ncbi:MAG: hypothetical protein OHK0038_08180 [Flammeovirgaceae bacterium]
MSNTIISEDVISTLDNQAVSHLFFYFKQQRQGQSRLEEAVKEWKYLLGSHLAVDDYLQLLTQHALCASFISQVSIEVAQRIQQSTVFQHFEKVIAFVSIPSEVAEITQKALRVWTDMLKKAKGANRRKIMLDALEDIFLYFVDNHSFESPSLEWQNAVAQYALDWVVTLNGNTFSSIETETFLPTFSEKLIQLSENEKIKINTYYNTNSLPLYYASFVTFPNINALLVDSLKNARLVSIQQSSLFQQISPLEDLLQKENMRKIALIFGEYSEEWLHWAIKRLTDNGLAVAFSSENLSKHNFDYQDLPLEEVRIIKTEEKNAIFFKKSSSQKQKVRILLGVAQKEGKRNYQSFGELDFRVLEEEKTSQQSSEIQKFRLWSENGKGVFDNQLKSLEIENEDYFLGENREVVEKNVEEFIQEYQKALQKSKSLFESIDFQSSSYKWTKAMKELLLEGVNLSFQPKKVISLMQKPFQLTFFYAESLLQGKDRNYFEKLLGIDYQQTNVFIVYSKEGLWASKELVHHRYWKDSIIFPKYIYNLDNQSFININNSILEAFKVEYLPKIKTEKEQLLSNSSVGAANMKELVEGLVKLSRNLPVLHKYTLRIFNLLPRKAEGNLMTEKALAIFRIVEEYEAKILALSKGAKERQKQYNQLKDSILQIKSVLEETIKIEEYAKQKVQLINPENIFYYVFGILSCKRQLEEEVFITFEDDFWQIAEKGKNKLDKILFPEKLMPFPLERFESEEFNGEVKLKFKLNKANGTFAIDSKTTLKGIPEFVWEKKLNGKPIISWWIEAQRKTYQPENKELLIENFGKFLQSLIDNEN